MLRRAPQLSLPFEPAHHFATNRHTNNCSPINRSSINRSPINRSSINRSSNGTILLRRRR